MATLYTSEQLARHQEFLARRFGLEMACGDKVAMGRRNNQTPSGPIREYRFVRDGREVAHHRFIPVTLEQSGHVMPGVQLSDAWVDEAYRGFGLMPVLLHCGLAALEQEGARFAYAFPNPLNVGNLQRHGRMSCLGTCHFLVQPVRFANLARRYARRLPGWLVAVSESALSAGQALTRCRVSGRFVVSQTARIPDGIDALLAQHAAGSRCAFVRDRAQLVWRFGHADYVKLVCHDRSGALVGMLVGREEVKGGLRMAGLLDCYAIAGDAAWDIVATLVRAFALHYAESDLRVALTVPGHTMDRWLRRMGYWPVPARWCPRPFPFLFRALGDQALSPIMWSDWHLSFYDSLDSF